MLSSSQRLSVEQFNKVMVKGRVTHSSLFLLRSLTDDSFKKAGVSAVAPVKIAKTAVARNKIRRQIYEAVRPLYSLLPNDTHVIVFAKSGALTSDFRTLGKDVKELFVKAGLLQ